MIESVRRLIAAKIADSKWGAAGLKSAVAGVILAAGMGTRMRSQLVKVLHPLGGKPMLTYPIEALRQAEVSRIIIVVGHQADRVRATVGEGVEYVVQEEQLGTGHAVAQTAQLLSDFDGLVLVTYGDTPLYRWESYAEFIQAHRDSGAVASVMSTHVDDPRGYGRIVRDEKGEFSSIVEQRDITSPQIDAIQEINTGTYCFYAPALFDALGSVTNDNEQGEYYLPDVLAILHKRRESVRIHVLGDPVEALGINDRSQLAFAEGIVKRRTLEALMTNGVTVIDPDSTYVHPSVSVGPDTVIHPFTSLEGTTRIGKGCQIGPHVRIVDSIVGDDVMIQSSYVQESRIDSAGVVGPFANLLPGSHIKKG